MNTYIQTTKKQDLLVVLEQKKIHIIYMLIFQLYIKQLLKKMEVHMEIVYY